MEEDTYLVKLENFEGPLDLLLHLVKEKEMDLMNLEISVITDQYLAYIEANQHLHLEVASEYLVMASYLIETKSRMLLPRNDVEVEDPYEEDPRQELISRLVEYRKYKEVVEALKLKKDERNAIFMKLPSNMQTYTKEMHFALPDNLEAYDLIVAMRKVMQRKVLLSPMKNAVAKKEISIEERKAEIKAILKGHENTKIPFSELFDEGDKHLFVVTFLAILVLANEKAIHLDQARQFDEIFVEVL